MTCECTCKRDTSIDSGIFVAFTVQDPLSFTTPLFLIFCHGFAILIPDPYRRLEHKLYKFGSGSCRSCEMHTVVVQDFAKNSFMEQSHLQKFANTVYWEKKKMNFVVFAVGSWTGHGRFGRSRAAQRCGDA